MNPTIILSCIAAYFLLLFFISYITGKNDSNDTFFLGNRDSPWFVIAYGMIGTTLSGITFISVPGWVACVPASLVFPAAAQPLDFHQSAKEGQVHS